VLLAGPTAGFVRLFDTGRTFELGPSTRIMDTGGAKGNGGAPTGRPHMSDERP
jgi:hypothetical protein